jgi:hypothetical protein
VIRRLALASLLSTLLGLALPASVPLLAARAAHAIEVRAEARELESYIEGRVKEALKTILPEDAHPIVSVHAVPLSAAKKASEPQDEKPLELGYVPIPIVSDFWKQQAPGAPQAQPPFEFESLQIGIQIPTADGKIEPALSKSIGSVVGKLLAGLNPVVSTTGFVRPPKPAEPPKAPEPEEPFLKKVPPDKLLMLGALLLGAIALAYAVYSIGRSLLAMSVSLTNGFLQLKETGESRAPQPAPAAPEAAKPAEMAITEKSVLPGAGDVKEAMRAVKSLKQVIRADAAIFSRIVSDSNKDVVALRRFLTHLDPEEQAAVKAALSPYILDKMSQVGGTVPDSLTPAEFGAWLQRAAETAVLKKIQGGSSVEAALGAETCLKLVAFKPAALLGAIKGIGTGAAWRIGAEFVPQAQFAAALNEAGEAQWRALLESATAASEELVKTAGQILETQGAASGAQSAADPSSADALEKRSTYYTSYLVAPVVSAIEGKALGEDDHFVAGLAQTSPEFVELVKSRIWTCGELDTVPDDYLRKVIKAMTNDERVALILSFPQAQSERLRSMVPEGNARTIVLDKVQKALAKPVDPVAQRANLAVSRRFLNRLRVDFAAKRFERGSGPAAAPASDNVTPIRADAGDSTKAAA